MKKSLLFLVCLILVSSVLFSQNTKQTAYKAKADGPHWIQLMYGENPNLLEVREAYEDYYFSNEFVKNKDTQYYKRWMRLNLMNASADGVITSEAKDLKKEQIYLDSYNSLQNQHGVSAWEEMGPWHFDADVAMEFQVQSPGASHVYTVEQSMSNPDVVWAGAATAGIWKSVDKGMHWELMSKDLLVTSVYSIEIDPLDENIVYFGQGTGTIWKTSDGGQNWTATGDENFQSSNFWCRDLRILPGENNTLFAATDEGLFRSSDAGVSWATIENGEFMEIEFHPENGSIVYAVRKVSDNTLFYKSVDGGNSFTSGANGWPSPGSGDDQRRCEMSVTPANPDKVVVLASGAANGGSGLYGIYISEDSGDNFEFVCCGSEPAGVPVPDENPNTLGWSEDGSGDGGQYYYDLGMAVSPTDEDRMFSAGICVWRSVDGGFNWDLNAHWVTWAGEFTAERYTHADVHDVKFFETDSGVDMWVASDGGVFYSSDEGDNFEPRMYGIHGTDFWGWQAGFKEGDVMVGGTYHNGTLIKNKDVYAFGLDDEENGGWLAELAGDNFRGFVNPGDPSIGYHDGGAFKYSEDRWTRISGATFDNSKRANTSYWWGEYGNMEWDPHCYNHIYSPVEDELWKSTNGGVSWELIHTFGGEKIINVKVSRANPDVIFVTHKENGSSWKIHRSDDGGVSWNIAGPSNAESNNNTNKALYIDTDAEDENILWCVIIGNHNGYKVLKSIDMGDSWSDYTSEIIQGEFITSIAHQGGTDGGVYIGSDKSVYYRDNTMDEWLMYNSNLPAKTQVVFLQPSYCDSKIRAAGTRGVHQCDFFTSSSPVAGISANRLEINLALDCDEDFVKFADHSIVECEGTSYQWVFEGGTPGTSDEMNPVVSYDETGTYDVTLTVTDQYEQSSTQTLTDLIIVNSEFAGFPISENFNAGFPPVDWKIYNPEGGGSWEQGAVLGDETNLVAQFPNYWEDTQDQTDLIIMPAQDFTDIEDPVLFFDVSYKVYSDYADGLAVWYKTGNDPEWNTLYEKIGTDLEVEDNYVWFWYDQGGEILWRTDTVNLATLAGEDCVQLAFANIGAYGNHIWVDNVNLNTYSSLGIEDHNDNAELLIYPNPSKGLFHVRMPSYSGAFKIDVMNSLGQTIYSEEVSRQTTIDLSKESSGVYYFRITEGEKVILRKGFKE